MTGAGLGGLERSPGVVAIGVDAIEISRIEAAITRRPRFVSRVYAAEERAYCEARAHPAKNWAARFAGKEAVMKSLGVGPGRVGWREIVILGPGRPRVMLRGGAAERAGELGVVRVEISLTHTRDLAIAVAAAVSM